MSDKQVKFTFRMAQDQAGQIDAKVAHYGFGTRSKFLTEAGLAYGQTAQFDDVMGALVDINFALHQLANTDTSRGAGRTQPDVKVLIREARKLMTAARGHLQR